MLPSLLRVLLAAAALLAVGAPSAGGAGRLDPFAGRLEAGIFSPGGEAAREGARAPFGLRTLYLTGGVRRTGGWAPGTQAGDGTREWLRESAAAGTTPVLTYYQLQPSARSGRDETARTRAVLRDKATMRAYWRDVRGVLKLARAHGRLVVLHVEPDGWQFFEQLQGVRTRAMVSATGLPELRGLPNDVRGYARAFVRLRDRYAPRVALGYHLSAWGTGQTARASVGESAAIGRLRASTLAATGARFDLALHDPGGTGVTPQSFAEHLALLGSFRDASRLPLVLWQVPTDGRVDWLLGPDPASRAHLAALRTAGVVGLLWDAGVPDRPSSGRERLLGRAAAAYAAGALG